MVVRTVLRIAEPVFRTRVHGLDRCARVARHLDFRNHLDMPRRCVAHDLDVVGSRKEPTAKRPPDLRTRAKRGLQEHLGVERVATSRAHRRQLRQTCDLDTPALVIREVHVEDVELVARHQVERAQHRGLRMEVACDVEHETAVAESGRVHDAHRWQDQPRTFRWRHQQSPEGLQAIEDTRRRDADDANTCRGIDHQLVRLRRRLAFDRTHLESQRDAALPGPDVWPEVFGGELCLARELGRCRDRRHRRDS